MDASRHMRLKDLTVGEVYAFAGIRDWERGRARRVRLTSPAPMAMFWDMDREEVLYPRGGHLIRGTWEESQEYLREAQRAHELAARLDSVAHLLSDRFTRGSTDVRVGRISVDMEERTAVFRVREISSIVELMELWELLLGAV